MIILGLHPKTKALMEEAFKGQVCCECGKPANRYMMIRDGKGKKTNEKFWCYTCYDPPTYDTIEFTERHVITHPKQYYKRKMISDV